MKAGMKNKFKKYKSKFFAVHPNVETVFDVVEQKRVPKHTDDEWVDELIKRFLIKEIRRGEKVIAMKAVGDEEIDISETIDIEEPVVEEPVIEESVIKETPTEGE